MKSVICILFFAGLLNWTTARAEPAYLLLDTGQGGQLDRALLLDTEVDIEVTGLIARAEVRQRFANHTGEWAEGRYVFPLPGDAAVDALTIRAGGLLIAGEIQERGQARETYRQARDAGRRAGLVEQERANLFTTSVANIGPHDEIEVRIGFDLPVHFEEGRFALRFPTTLVARHVPGAPIPADVHSARGQSPDTDQVPDGSRVTPTVSDDAGLLTLSMVLRPGIELSSVVSSHHPVRVERIGDEWFVYLLDSAGNRDVELTWTPAVPDQAHTAVFTEHFEGEDYVMVLLLPPQQITHRPPPRELILVIDTSGSMQGTPIQQAREALLIALDTLGPDDRFNIIEFNHLTSALFDTPVAALDDALIQAHRYVNGLRAAGGTVMDSALDLANAGAPSAGYLRQIVFITDGAVANESQLLARIDHEIGESRLFSIGIGHGVNHHFLRSAARRGRGSYTSIAETGQIAERMSELILRLETPAIQHIELDWPNGADMYPERVPDLYLGEPLMAVARVAHADGLLIAGGWQGEQVWQQALSLDRSGYAPGVARLWARKRIETLQGAALNGMDPEIARQDILNTALRFQLLSPYTALVAVERTAARPPGETLAAHDVPATRPAGRGGHAWPATATGKLDRWMRGLIALALLLLLVFGHWQARDEGAPGR